MLGNKIRGYTRLILFTLVTVFFFILVLITSLFPGDKYALRLSLRKVWSGIALFLLGYKVEKRGNFPADRNYLYVGNHRSSLDPFICLAHLKANPVSRADVRNYPVLGKGAEMSGIIFVHKESRSSRNATKEAIYNALKEGKSVMIYPEGKTGAQPLTATFQKGSFDIAAELGIPVVPFVMEYKSTKDYWDHTDTMAEHYFKYLAKPRTYVRLSVGQPISNDNSWALLRQSQEWINDEIIRLREDWGGVAEEKGPGETSG